MLPLTWHQALALFLVVTPHVLLGVLAVVLRKRRLYQEFPFFLAYALYELTKFIPLFALYLFQGAGGKQYAYVYSITLLISIILRFGIIEEVAKVLFRESEFLKMSARRSLRCVTVVLFAAGVLLAIYAPANHRFGFVAGVLVINRGAAMVQSGLLLALFLFARFLGLSWYRPAFGIALGLGILTSVDLAMFALRAEFPSAAAAVYLNLLMTGAYLLCVLVWIAYSLAPEVEPVTSLAILSKDEVETWNMELQHLLRD